MREQILLAVLLAALLILAQKSNMLPLPYCLSNTVSHAGFKVKSLIQINRVYGSARSNLSQFEEN